jgi:pimeloyl-ACP methyl ester carboxylesterase
MILFLITLMAKFSCILVSAVVGLVAPQVAAAETRYFPHADERYLFAHQHNGAAALLPEDVTPGTEVPLVVFLHGTNSSGDPHLWLGGGSRDLRPVALRLMKERKVRPFVVAGPSQTKGAALARTLWDGFDLDEFVSDVVAATQDAVQIDRRQIIVAGHSGAGCNPTGGLATQFWTAASVTPFALASIDPCLDEEMGGAFAKRPAQIPLLVWWQSAIWPRDPDAFWAALIAGKPAERVDRLTKLPARGPNPHDAIVPLAFDNMLRELLPNEPAVRDEDVTPPT